VYDERRLPLNRIIAFLGPYVAVVAGALASWLLVHVHALGLFKIGHDQLATAIAQGAVFLLTAGLSWAGSSKWLTGHQILLGAAGPAGAPALAAAGIGGAAAVIGAPYEQSEPYLEGPPEVVDPGALPPGPDDVHAEPGDVERLGLQAPPPPPRPGPVVAAPQLEAPVQPTQLAYVPETLPTDDEELAAPPPGGYLDIPDEPDDADPELPESSLRPDPPEEM
jgi:hypothetical protein